MRARSSIGSLHLACACQRGRLQPVSRRGFLLLPLSGSLANGLSSRRPMIDGRVPIFAELDRLGAGYRKAGADGHISVQLGAEEIKLVGPPREHPRRLWLGLEWQALEILTALPDDAGTETVWRTLSRW